LIFQRAQGYQTTFLERRTFYDAGLGVELGQQGDGGDGPIPSLALFARGGDVMQDRFGNDLTARVAS
jgi:hypothetical protein